MVADTTQQAGRSTFESFGRKVDARVGNIGPKVEEEVRRVITYLNDEVVPQVRRNSSTALRTAAEQLSKLAERLEENRPAQPQPAPEASSEVGGEAGGANRGA